ncbi:MAG: lytic transglycosylase domain-containing protein [Clostridia bacterium]|nr:lytic transglycosylase domain-containing protein [Clostridia bacterium]
MKRTISIICILIISALVAFFWVEIDDAMTKHNHPLKYVEYVEEYAQLYAVPKELVYAVIKAESNFESDAVSSKGATGLMQIMPETYTWLCDKYLETSMDPQLLFTPEINIKFGTLYLSFLYSKFGNWETAVAAYNAGPTKVEKWLSDSEISENGVLVNVPYEETEKYIKKVMKAKNNYKELYFADNK